MSTPDDDRKRTAAAVAVTPEKKRAKTEEHEHDDDDHEDEAKTEEDNEGSITAASIMGFPKYPNMTNGDIMTNHYSFVVWAKRKRDEDDVYGNLAKFLEWAETPEGKRLGIEGQGKEEFGFGKHKGKSFVEIARDDPKYHERYMAVLREKGKEPFSVLTRYIDWFDAAGMARRAALQIRSNQVASGRRRVNPSSNDGNLKFKSGRHSGRTFRQVAREDPSYHLRCKATGYNQDEVMARYVQYFNRHGDHNAAARDERDAIGAAIGIMPPECYGLYDIE